MPKKPAPKEIECYAIKAPNGHIITWTCYVYEEHPWLEYLGKTDMDDEVRAFIKFREAEGYRRVKVRITEVT